MMKKYLELSKLFNRRIKWDNHCPEFMPNSTETGGTPLRIITAAAIFDGHDAAIGIFRRIFQSMGCEVIHLDMIEVLMKLLKQQYKKMHIALQ